MRRWVVRPLVWLVCALAVALVLLATVGRRWGENELRRLAEDRLSIFLEREVTIDDLRLELLPFGVEVRGLTVAGPSPADEPFGHLERARAILDVGALLSRTIRLSEVVAVSPYVVVARYADGTDNLIRRTRRRPAGKRRLAVQIETLEVIDGAFVLDDHEVPIDLAAYEVRGTLLDLGEGDFAVQGSWVSERVEVVLPGGHEYAFGIAGKVIVDRERVEVATAHLSSPELFLRVAGLVSWRPRPEVELVVNATASAGLVSTLGYHEGPFDGQARLEGAFHWSGEEGWALTGEVTSDRLELLGRELTEVAGRLRVAPGLVTVGLAAGRYAGGDLEGTVEVATGVPRRTSASLRLEGAELARLARDQRLPLESLSSSVDGTVDYRFDDTAFDRGSGWLDLLLMEREPDAGQVSAAGGVTLSVDDGVIRSDHLVVRTPGQVVTGRLRHELSTESGSVALELSSTDLVELSRVLPVSFDGTLELLEPQAGLGSGRIVLSWSPSGPTIEADLDLSDVVSRGVVAERVRGVLAVSPSGVDRIRFELERPGGALLVRGRIPAEGEWNLGLDAVGWPLDQTAVWVPFPIELEGAIHGHLELVGQGEELAGELQATVPEASWRGFDLGDVGLDLRWNGDEVVVSGADVRSPLGLVTGVGSLDLASRALRAEVVADRLDLESILPGTPVAGEAQAVFRVSGTLECPLVSAEGEVWRLGLGGHPVGEDARLVWRAGLADELLELEAEAVGALAVAGGGTIDASGLDLRFRVASPDLGHLGVAGWLPELGGAVAGTLEVHGPWGAPVGRLELPDAVFAWSGYELRSIEPVVVGFVGGVIEVTSVYLGSADGAGELFVHGTVALEPSSLLDLRVQASLDRNWLVAALPSVQAEAPLDLLLTVRGPMAAPRLDGVAELHDGRLLVPGFPHSIDGAAGILLFNGREVLLDTFNASLAGGDLQAEGEVRWEDGRPVGRLQMAARRLSLRYPEGWRLEGGAELLLSVEASGRVLRGDVDLARAYYLKDLEVGVTQLLDQFLRRQRLQVDEADEFLAGTQIALSLRVPDGLRVRNNLAELDGSANLVVRGTLARPVVFGTVEAKEGGTLVFAENRYTVERGLLTFANPYEIEPVIDLVARSEVREYDIRLNLSGSLDRLNVDFSSDPPLAELEVLSLMATGDASKISEIGSGTGTASGAAAGFLYGQAASLISRRVNTLFGFDSFRVEPLVSSRESVANVRVSATKRLSRDLSVSYSYDPASTEEQRLRLEWQIRPGLTMILTQNGDGSYSVDTLWERRF